MILRGFFHKQPAGTRIWQCATCDQLFMWDERSSQWGNIEYPAAVFCSDPCAAKWLPTRENRKQVAQPVGVLNEDRVHVDLSPYGRWAYRDAARSMT